MRAEALARDVAEIRRLFRERVDGALDADLQEALEAAKTVAEVYDVVQELNLRARRANALKTRDGFLQASEYVGQSLDLGDAVFESLGGGEVGHADGSCRTSEAPATGPRA